MTPPIKTIALFARQQSDTAAQTLIEIGAFLAQRGFRAVFEPLLAQTLGRTDLLTAPIDEVGPQADLAVIVGGDGTMLGVARELAPHGVPLVGINSGRLGFITDVPLAGWRPALDAILEGHYESEERAVLNARVIRDSQTVFEASAVNDVVVSRNSRAGMIEVLVHVDGLFMYRQRADGLIVATPTGSTAYALSCNGPILHPGLHGLVLVPVAPQALSNRPIVLPSSSVITISVTEGREPRLNCDMQNFADVHVNDVVEIRKARHSARFLHPQGYSYYATLRSKLNWHEMPSLTPPP